MDFTIVTPSYNYGRYMTDCLKSVAEQEGVTFEHLVMDAGSTDETAEVVAGFPHASFFEEPDKGMSDGINKGFLKAQGEWVMWLNADDFLLPGALAKIKEFASRYPQTDVVYGGWNYVDKDKHVLRVMRMFPFDLMMQIHYGTYIGSTACFFRRQTTIQQGLLLNTHFRVNMDGEYYARLGKAGKQFAQIPEILAGFRWHGQNTSIRDKRKNHIDHILAFEKQLAESVAIRRAYGWTLTRSIVLNTVIDGILGQYFRAKKVIIKLFHKCYLWQN
jgi:glycosyltransferase involved in cell wall biosynthesis